jgi:hypothetical protein
LRLRFRCAGWLCLRDSRKKKSSLVPFFFGRRRVFVSSRCLGGCFSSMLPLCLSVAVLCGLVGVPVTAPRSLSAGGASPRFQVLSAVVSAFLRGFWLARGRGFRREMGLPVAFQGYSRGGCGLRVLPEDRLWGFRGRCCGSFPWWLPVAGLWGGFGKGLLYPSQSS